MAWSPEWVSGGEYVDDSNQSRSVVENMWVTWSPNGSLVNMSPEWVSGGEYVDGMVTRVGLYDLNYIVIHLGICGWYGHQGLESGSVVGNMWVTVFRVCWRWGMCWLEVTSVRLGCRLCWIMVTDYEVNEKLPDF